MAVRKPSINYTKRTLTSNDFNATGRSYDVLLNASKLAEELSYHENKPNIYRQQVVKKEENVSPPLTSVVNLISSFFGGESSNQGTNLYHYSEETNPCEPPPEAYANLKNKALFEQAFTIKTYIKDASIVSNIKPNDIIIGQYLKNSSFEDFIPLDSFGTITQNIENFQNAVEAFANGIPYANASTISETSNCSASINSDFAFFAQPCNATITSTYGMRQRPAGPSKGTLRMHHGIDMANSVGTPIYAAYDGTVIYENKSLLEKKDENIIGRIELSHNIVNGLPDKKVSTVGNIEGNLNSTETTLISGTYKTRYLHMLQITVSNGTKVKTGQLIGYMSGQDEPYSIGTGKENGVPISTGPHLHFEIIHPNGQSIDPIQVFGWGKKTVGNSRCTTPEIEAQKKANELAALQQEAANSQQSQTTEQIAATVAENFSKGNFEAAIGGIGAAQQNLASSVSSGIKRVGNYLGF